MCICRCWGAYTILFGRLIQERVFLKLGGFGRLAMMWEPNIVNGVQLLLLLFLLCARREHGGDVCIPWPKGRGLHVP